MYPLATWHLCLEVRLVSRNKYIISLLDAFHVYLSVWYNPLPSCLVHKHRPSQAPLSLLSSITNCALSLEQSDKLVSAPWSHLHWLELTECLQKLPQSLTGSPFHHSYFSHILCTEQTNLKSHICLCPELFNTTESKREKYPQLTTHKASTQSSCVFSLFVICNCVIL